MQIVIFVSKNWYVIFIKKIHNFVLYSEYESFALLFKIKKNKSIYIIILCTMQNMI